MFLKEIGTRLVHILDSAHVSLLGQFLHIADIWSPVVRPYLVIEGVFHAVVRLMIPIVQILDVQV